MDKKAEIVAVESYTDTWDQVFHGMVQIFKRKPMTPKYYMELYQAVYKYCSATSIADVCDDLIDGYKKEEEALRATPTRLRFNYCDTKLSRHVTGGKLYSAIRNFLIQYCEMHIKKCEELSAEPLLEYFAREWDKYKFSAKVLDGIYGYLNRHWTRREQKEGVHHVYDVRSTALQIFRGTLFTVLEPRLRAAVMDEIRKERSGETINGRLISALVDSLIECGGDKLVVCGGNGPELAPPLHAYKDYFETPFLDQARSFYAVEVHNMLQVQKLSCKEYMEKVCARFEEEERRVTLMLHSSTREPLRAVCTEVMVKEQLEWIQSHFEPLLKEVEEVDEDLGRMYDLCSRVPGGLRPLRRVFYPFVWNEGHSLLEERWQQASTDPIFYAGVLMDVLWSYQKMVNTVFRKDAGFEEDLATAAYQFINLNVVVKTAPENEHRFKSAEWIAKYCDLLMNKNSKNARIGLYWVEEMQKQVIEVFKLVDDKDAFLKFYTKMFCKRLLTDFSYDDEFDVVFLAKLTECCGHDYTSRLTKMLRDYMMSKDLNREFKETGPDGEAKKMEFAVKVLSTGVWPSFPQMPLKLHRILASVVEEFKAFYDTKHNGRRLQWVFSQCRGELACSAFKRKRYVFGTTTAQMCTLLLFNESTSYTAEALMNGTGMTAKNAATVIGSLVKHQVLSSDAELSAENEVPMTAKVTLNSAYTNKKVRVDLSKMTVAVQQARDSEQVKKTVEEDRKNVMAIDKSVEEDRKNIISACIIRIMKTRQSISHQHLMTEVIAQLSERFKPNTETIKTAIELLIEKEYMKRNDEKQNLYEYVA